MKQTMNNPLITELEARWQQMFSALAAGDDLPPGPRLRAEGMMESAVLLQLASAQEIQQRMELCYQAAYGHSLGDDFGPDWRDFYPFPQIPAVSARAPVFPSTSD